MRTARRDTKALIEVSDEGWQEGIALLHVGDTLQAHFLDQAVLQGLVGSFHAAFRLGGVGTEDLDIQLLHRTPKLRQSLS